MALLQPELVWRAAGADARTLDPRLLSLLRALRDLPTLRAAAEQTGLSYRGAWGLLMEGTTLAGAPLAELQRGRGARLTPYGSSLLDTDERMRHAISRLAAKPGATPEPGPHSGGSPLRLVASHDPLLAEFCERYARPAGLIGEVSFRGSEASLAAYAQGSAELAGFHLDGGGDHTLLRHLKPRRDRLILFADRAQGLMVARGNPKGFASVADIARKRARFVNRQKGSGTRLLIDRLLDEAQIQASRIQGYDTEEYTHLAVAATVATGRADVGVGVQAAAAQFGLAFVPLVEERYWLVVRERQAAGAQVQQLLRALAGKPLARMARHKPGYEIRQSGAMFSAREVMQ